MSEITTTATELPGARVRLDVVVEAADVERRVEEAAKRFGSEMKIPGFRAGKVPPEIVKQRVGVPALIDEAIKDALPEWYVAAVEQTGVQPIGPPKVDLRDATKVGEPVKIAIDVPVVPIAKLGNYRGIEVGRGKAAVEDGAIDEQLEAMRERFAKLETVERAARQGDFVVIDFVGRIDGDAFEGGTAQDYLLELGGGRLLEGFEDQLVGAAAGANVTVNVAFPAEYGKDELAGRPATFDVTVKEVKEKVDREIDDELALEMGFDTVAELRDDIRSALTERAEAEVENAYRVAALDAVAAQAAIDVPHDHIHTRSHEMWHETADALARRGVDPRQYLQLAGKTEEELVTAAEPEAEAALRRQAAVAAVIEAESITVSEDEMLEAVAGAAEEAGVSSAEMLERLRVAGRERMLREDLAAGKAVDILVAAAKPIDLATAEARDRMWTPEKGAREDRADAAKSAPKLWTPGA